jgi:hypothetical protein
MNVGHYPYFTVGEIGVVADGANLFHSGGFKLARETSGCIV